jgi:D-arabinose 1-dehydrogenase-like Zn-dependent alcohol dehydrogenase
MMVHSSPTMNVPSMQRAQVLTSFNQPYVFKDNHPRPREPEGYELLVHVRAASYCHTDAVFASGAMQQELPRIGSHEFCGHIHSFGPQAKNAAEDLGLKSGMLVGVPGRAMGPCGSCQECSSGEAAGDYKGYGVWCTKAGNLGLTRHGGFEDFCLVDSRQVAPVPEGMQAVEVAPLMCAGVTVWNALAKAGIDMTEKSNNTGRKIAILGAGGGLGHLGVQFASLLDVEVLAVDVASALDMVRDVQSVCSSKGGAPIHVVDAKDDVEEVKRRLFGGAETGLEGERGCDASIVLPEAQAAFDFGMGILRNHGTCVVVSFPKDGWSFQPRDVVFRHINVVGVLVGRNKQLREMLNFAAETGVRAKVRTYALEDLNKLVDDYHKGAGGKLVVDMEQAKS